MDVTVVRSSFSGLEAGLDSCIDASPSFLSRFFSFPGIEIDAQSQVFWTWSALVLALIAALSKLSSAALNVLIRAGKPPSSAACSQLQQPLFKTLGDEDDDLSGDEDGETTSAASSEGDRDGDDDPAPSSSRHPQPVYEDHSGRVAGDFYFDRRETRNFNLHPRRSLSPWLSNVAAGNNVVKLWGDRDSIGIPFLAGSSQVPGATVASSSVLVAAVSDGSRNLSLGVWDRRIRRRTPAICAEWMTRPTENGSAHVLTVGDLRNVISPVAKLTEAGEGSWWDADADAVVVTNDAVGDGAVNGCDPSIATRWLDVVWRCLL